MDYEEIWEKATVLLREDLPDVSYKTWIASSLKPVALADDRLYLEDVDLNEFRDEIDSWIIDALKAVGCDTAKSVLELPVEEIASRADLELEQAQKVVEILKAEFE